MTTDAQSTRTPRLRATLRENERVTPLELFFDLVFVLAITQCTALMAADPTWEGLAKGAARARDAVVGVGRLRVAHERRGPGGGRRAARDVRRDGRRCSWPRCACRDAFGDTALEFALAYTVVRVAHLALFGVASRDDPSLRRAVITGLVGQHGDRRRAAGRGVA